MDNADLDKLRVNTGKLVPKFSSSVLDYSVNIGSSVSEIKLTVLTSDSGASYAIKGSEGGGKVVPIAEGQTRDVDIIVSAEDGTSTKTYSIKMHRLSTDDATLSQLELSAGQLTPPFSPSVYTYESYLPCSIDNLTMRAKTEESAMRVTMDDGSPVGTVQLNPGRTQFVITVESANGMNCAEYTILFNRSALPPTLYLKTMTEEYECAVCCGVVNRSTQIDNGLYVYCQECLEELTRTNKMDPFTGQNLGEGKWMKMDFDRDTRLGKEMGVCPLPGGKLETPLNQMGSTLMMERQARAEEVTGSCKECSMKIPHSDLALHKEFLCIAKHSMPVKKHAVTAKFWEKRLIDETIGSNVNDLMKTGSDWEEKYRHSLPSSAHVHHGPNEAPLDYLMKAARAYATAIQAAPKDCSTHLALGIVLEEFFYAEDLFGQTQEESMEVGEGEAEASSKEEEFFAICKIHGVSSGSPVAIQLKAVESEYQSLKDMGQTHKADHVQGLYAWKSKKILEAGQGSYSVDRESPLYKAKFKYQDAVSIDSSNGVACYHLGRLSLLLGEKEMAKEYLTLAVSLKPTLSPARFCLGLILPFSSNIHTKTLLVHGLTEYLTKQQALCETSPEPHKEKMVELHPNNFYRSTNTLIVDGFLQLASLSGGGHLTALSCLLSVTSCVGRAHLQHRCSTYERLHWSSLKARAMLLNLFHRQSNPSALRHCRQLSALIECSGLEASSHLRDMQMDVFQLGVLLQPNSSEALCHLGNGQLIQYDASNQAFWLEDAELSFRASIEMEGKPIVSTSIPDKLKEEKWWRDREALTLEQSTKPAAPSKAAAGKKAAIGATGRQQAGTKQSTSTTKQAPGGRNRSFPASRASTTGTKVQGGAARTSSVATTSKTTPARTSGSVSGTARSSVKPGGAHKSAGSSRAISLAGGKGVATLGELKAGASSSTATTQQQGSTTTVPKETTATAQKMPPEDTTTSMVSVTSNPEPAQHPAAGGANVEINQPSYHQRLGLARTLSRSDDSKKHKEAHLLYEEVMVMSPFVHNAYIELGELLSKTDPIGAVEVYANFPFDDCPSFDDAFLHGEIIRLLMKSENYDNAYLASSMIAMGKALGIGVLEKQVAVLEEKFKSSLLKRVYAGVHDKPLDDPELQAFFKFKCWF